MDRADRIIILKIPSTSQQENFCRTMMQRYTYQYYKVYLQHMYVFLTNNPNAKKTLSLRVQESKNLVHRNDEECACYSSMIDSFVVYLHIRDVYVW